MRRAHPAGCLLLLAILSSAGSAQVEDLREATGLPFAIDQSVIYGQIVLEGVPPAAKRPMVYVSLIGRNVMSSRTSINKSGYYFFRETPREGGTIVVEVDGVEYGRQPILPGTAKQQRYDFNIVLRPPSAAPKPGTISAKYAYERSKENTRLLDKAASAAEKKDPAKAISYLKRLLENDPKDFAAWTLLGSVYFNDLKYPEAEAAYNSALEAKSDLAYTMVNLGKLYLAQKQYDKAVTILLKATQTEPDFAMAFRVLGEAYLRSKKGSLAVSALNEALRIAPVEMAECHLRLAWLYDAAGDKKRATAEYTAFLKKVPDHPEKSKIEKYVRENPE